MPAKCVVVADSNRARIFALQGRDELSELEDLVNPEARQDERELRSDADGRFYGKGERSEGHVAEPSVSPKQHEAELIQAAKDRQSAGSPAHGIPDRCPACGHEMIRRDEVEGIPVAECRVCDWIAVDHDQLDKLLARSSRDDRH